MTCKNCDPNIYYPGKVIKSTQDLKHCAVCGDELQKDSNPLTTHNSRWDKYFHNICESVASKSPCLSRKIGAILVKDHSIISTGYNGPPRGVPHCGDDRFMKDEALNYIIDKELGPGGRTSFMHACPRRVLGYESGTHMELCPAQHAEENAVSNAARLGVSVLNSTLYMNSVIPCQKCYGTLINAGIKEIVVSSAKVYDQYTKFLIDNSDIVIREFDI